MPQLSQVAVVVMSFLLSWARCTGACGMNKCAQRTEEPGDLVRGQPGQRGGEQVRAEHLALAAQGVLPGRGQPDQRAPPVGRVALALQHALALQVADDLADHRLRAVQVRRCLAARQRPGEGEVLEYRERGVRQLAARAIPPVEGQVHRPEELGELPGPRLVAAHHDRLSPCRSIVNPDGYGPTITMPAGPTR